MAEDIKTFGGAENEIDDRTVYTVKGADATFVKKTDVKTPNGMDLNRLLVSPEEFQQYTGINLVFRLVEGNMVDGDSHAAAQAFIERIQRRLNNYIDTHFSGNIGKFYFKPSDNQRYHYKLAVIEQVLYIFSNTAITESMGLNDDGYPILSKNDIRQREIGIECQRELELAGLWTRSLNSGMGFYSFWWRF